MRKTKLLLSKSNWFSSPLPSPTEIYMKAGKGINCSCSLQPIQFTPYSTATNNIGQMYNGPEYRYQYYWSRLVYNMPLLNLNNGLVHNMCAQLMLWGGGIQWLMSDQWQRTRPWSYPLMSIVRATPTYIKDSVNNIMDKFNGFILSMKLIDEKYIYINLIDAVRTFNCYHDSWQAWRSID